MAFNFREVEHNLCIAIDSTMSTMLSAGEDYGANAVICYGYVDKQAGLTFEVLCLASYIDGDYAVRNGLKATTNNDNLIGINLDTYIPELRLAIEVEATTITEQRSQMVKEHICECNGIRYVKLKHSNDLIKTAQSIKEAFRKCHTFFQTNDEEDIEILRTRFQNWRKQK